MERTFIVWGFLQMTQFDLGIIWKTLIKLWQSFLGRVPYIVLGLLAFLFVWGAGKLIKRAIHEAGEHTR